MTDTATSDVTADTDRQTPSLPEWAGALPDDLKAHVEKNGYRDPAAVVKADMHAQRLLGAERLPLPDEDGDLEEWPGWAALGVPESRDGYDVTRPDLPDGLAYDEGLENRFLDAAHALKLTPAQTQGLIDVFSGYQTELFSAAQDDAAQDDTVLQEALQTDWGDQYEANLDLARRATRAFAEDDETFDALQGALGDQGIVRFFHKLGTLMSEDSLAGAGETGHGLTPDDARTEAAQVERQLASLLNRQDAGGRDERRKLEARRRALLSRAYPSS